MVKVTIPIRAMPKERPRFNFKNKRAYTPEKTRKFEQVVKMFLPKMVPLEGPLSVRVIFSFTVSKKVRLENRFPYKKTDLDNTIKSLLDACNGALWIDDSQVCQIVAQKIYGDLDYIELEVFKI